MSNNIIDKKRDDEQFQVRYLFINVGSCCAMIQIRVATKIQYLSSGTLGLDPVSSGLYKTKKLLVNWGVVYPDSNYKINDLVLSSTFLL